MTIKELSKIYIAKLNNISTTALLDVQVLFCHILNKNTAWLLTHSDFELGESQKDKLDTLVNRRQKHEPIAYLIENKEFFGLDFYVDKNVLIPRPESEKLIEDALQWIDGNRREEFNILDIGTGSGCLIISLAKSIKKLEPTRYNFFASDVSDKALSVAKRNMLKVCHSELDSESPLYKLMSKQRQGENHHSEVHIDFIKSNLFSNPLLHRKYDIIIANLPYVPFAPNPHKAESQDIDFEPQNAIFAKDNGTEIINNFLSQSFKFIKDSSIILMELDPRNAHNVFESARTTYPKAKIILDKDLAGLDRYLTIKQ
jgi:release factor glutamine methyltransferase